MKKQLFYHRFNLAIQKGDTMSKSQGVLFHNTANGQVGYHEEGDEKNDGNMRVKLKTVYLMVKVHSLSPILPKIMLDNSKMV